VDLSDPVAAVKELDRAVKVVSLLHLSFCLQLEKSLV